jgi:hypothetical protein
MVPSDFHDFISASITSAASFIGLIFVALTFIVDKSGKDEKQLAKESMLAIGSFTALLDIFIVSLVAIEPHTEIGHVMAIMGIIGLSNSWRLIKAGLKSGVGWGTFAISTIDYAIQIIYGIVIIYSSHHTINPDYYVTMTILLFSSALGRAWELTGISHPGEHK